MAGAFTSFLQVLGGVIASWLIAYLPDHSALPMGITIFVLVCFAIVSFNFRAKA